MANKISYSLLLFVLCLPTGVLADNYYLQAIKNTVITAEMLEKSAEKVKKHKDIKVLDDLEVPPFHKRGEWEKESLSKTFCTQCHLQPPHTKNLRSRVFLNMHTQFVACETCHLRPEGVLFDYQWQDYARNLAVASSPTLFRQFVDKSELPKNGESRARKMNPMIKIVPYQQGNPAFILRGDTYAEETASIWKSQPVDQRIKRRADIHAPLEEKGPKCEACHQRDKPMIDLVALGANKGQVSRIQQHIVPQFFKRYKEDDQRIKINNLLQ